MANGEIYLNCFPGEVPFKLLPWEDAVIRYFFTYSRKDSPWLIERASKILKWKGPSGENFTVIHSPLFKYTDILWEMYKDLHRHSLFKKNDHIDAKISFPVNRNNYCTANARKAKGFPITTRSNNITTEL